MTEIRHLENRKTPYLDEKLSDFDEIWHTNTDLEYGDSHVTECEIFFLNFQDGERPPFKRIVFGHNAAADCPVSVKFCTGKQNSMLTEAA